jgi:hypothetical protein
MEPLLDKEAREARIVRGEALRRTQQSLYRPAAFHPALGVLLGIGVRLMRWTMLATRRRATVGRRPRYPLRNCAMVRRQEP